MDWMKLFPQRILIRGNEYYEDGQVVDFSIDDNKIYAEVEGSIDYQVEIELGDDSIVDMDCDCPYAVKGYYCKHMAAVLFQYEEHLSENEEKISLETLLHNSIDKKSKRKSDAESLVKKIPEDEIRNLMVEFLLNDESLFNKLKLEYDFKMDLNLMARLKSQFINIISRYGGMCSFIDWSEASDYAHDLNEYLDTNIPLLLSHKCNLQAFELVNMVYHEVGTREMDDSEGGTEIVLRNCYEYWERLWDNSNDLERQNMKMWFKNHLNIDYVIDFVEDYMIEFYDQYFLTKEEIEEKIAALDCIIQKNNDKNDSGNIFFMYSGVVSAVIKRLEYMERLGISKEEIDQYKKDYRHFSEIREMEINQAIIEGNKLRAMEILEESKIMDADNPRKIVNYSKRLISFYKEFGMKDKMKEELIYQIFHGSQTDLIFYREYKSCINSQTELNHLIEKIMDQVQNSYYISMILCEEKRFEDLMTIIEDKRMIDLADTYEKHLKKYFPDRIMQIYIDYITSEMDRVSDRKHYKYLVKYLKKISKYPDGKNKAFAIANQWRVTYKRRTALRDELKKAGF